MEVIGKGKEVRSAVDFLRKSASCMYKSPLITNNRCATIAISDKYLCRYAAEWSLKMKATGIVRRIDD